MVTIQRKPNPLDDKVFTAELPVLPTASLARYIPADFDADQGAVYLDDELVRKEEIPHRKVCKDSLICLFDMPGDDVFNDFNVIGAVVGAARGFIFGGPVGSITGAFSGGFLQTGFSAGNLFNIQQGAVTGFVQGDLLGRLVLPFLSGSGGAPGGSGFEDTIGFRGNQTTIGPGRVLPLVYGKVRAGGHIVETFFSPTFEESTEPDEVSVVNTNEPENTIANRLNTRIALCAGPIKSVSDIEIDDNPVANYRGIQYETLLGTVDQKPPEGFDEAKNTENVGVLIEDASSHAERTNAPATAVEVELKCRSGIFEVKGRKNLAERSVLATIRYKSKDDGSYTTWKQVTLADASRNARSFWFRISDLTEDIYDIRVERDTADNTDPAIQDEFHFERLVVVNKDVRAHPGVAQLMVRQIAGHQTPVPRKYTAIVEGFDDIRQYTSEAEYTRGWTDNPAWCFLHWLTHPIYGLGRFYGYDDVELDTFIEWAAYCDEQVADGRGSTRKRCRFNATIDASMAVPDIITLFTQGQRASIIDEGGRWRAIVQKPRTAGITFNEGNMLEDSFRYSIVDKSQRANWINASFLNEENNYEADSIHDNLDVGETQAFVKQSIQTLGITEPAQVMAMLNRILLENSLRGRTVEFETTYLSGKNLKVGDIFAVSVRDANIGLASGRLQRISDDLLTLYLDQEFTLSQGTSYELTIYHIRDETTTTATVNVTNTGTDETNIVKIDVPDNWEGTLRIGDLYALGQVNESRELFECVDVSTDGDFTQRVAGLFYDPDVDSDDIHTNPTDNNESTIRTTKMPTPPSTVTVVSNNVQDSAGDTTVVIDASWEDVIENRDAANYHIFYRIVGETRWRHWGRAEALSVRMQGLFEAGTQYELSVVPAASAVRRLSAEDGTKTTVNT